MSNSRRWLARGVAASRLAALGGVFGWCLWSGHWPLALLMGLLVWEAVDLARHLLHLGHTLESLGAVNKAALAAPLTVTAKPPVAPPAEPAEPDTGQPQWLAQGHIGPKGES